MSYFLFKPEIMYKNVCYNAYTEICKKCKQSECELAGQIFEKKGVKKVSEYFVMVTISNEEEEHVKSFNFIRKSKLDLKKFTKEIKKKVKRK